MDIIAEGEEEDSDMEAGYTAACMSRYSSYNALIYILLMLIPRLTECSTSILDMEMLNHWLKVSVKSLLYQI